MVVPPAVPAIRVENLSKRFSTTLAVDELSLTVPPGEVFGFLGPNGAGKSTTIRLLLGLLRPTGGAAWIFDEPVHEQQLKFPRNYSAPPQKGVTNGPEHRGSSLQTRAGDDPERL